jgi:hypothetical protein
MMGTALHAHRLEAKCTSPKTHRSDHRRRRPGTLTANGSAAVSENKEGVESREPSTPVER